MESDVRNDDVYSLIGELCKAFLQKVRLQEDNPYFPQINKTQYLRKFRSRAYEILLKKTAHEPGKISQYFFGFIFHNKIIFCFLSEQ